MCRQMAPLFEYVSDLIFCNASVFCEIFYKTCIQIQKKAIFTVINYQVAGCFVQKVRNMTQGLQPQHQGQSWGMNGKELVQRVPTALVHSLAPSISVSFIPQEVTLGCFSISR